MPVPTSSSIAMASPLEVSAVNLSINSPAEADRSLSDADSEDEQHQAATRPKESERRRVQHARFSAWLSRRTEKITQDEVQTIIDNADEETLSIRSLVAKQAATAIIKTPREYQLELFERAKNQNIIAVLDTGQCCHSRHNVASLTDPRLRQNPYRSPTIKASDRPRA